jgi:hypothetical protein
MYKKILLILFISICSGKMVFAQSGKEKTAVDSSLYYDDLFGELENFLDSITAPKSFITVNLGIGKGFLNYQSNSSTLLKSDRQLMLSPSVGYFHKSGIGINAAVSIANDSGSFNPYQLALTTSYDYVQNKKLLTGVSFTRYFTKDSLHFYTSPLQNEMYAYVAYRGIWLKPSIGLNYGWGSKTTYEKRESYITALRLRRTGYTTVSTTEKVSDFTVTTSVKHDFYWLKVFTDKDHIKLTPQLVFVAGTQKFGFNQVNNSYVTNNKTGTKILYNSNNTYLSDQTRFKPLSISARLRPEYAIGKFFIQPQFLVDYFIPDIDDKLVASFAINTGFLF